MTVEIRTAHIEPLRQTFDHVEARIGKGKAAEVPVAIAKAVQQAKKHLVHVPLKEGTIPHEVHGLFGGEHVMLKPAGAGTGPGACQAHRPGSP